MPTFSYTNFINTASLPVTIPIGLTWGANPHLPTASTMQFILNVQRTVGKSTALEVGYTGSVSRHLAYLSDQNQGILSPTLSVGATSAVSGMGRFGNPVSECRRQWELQRPRDSS